MTKNGGIKMPDVKLPDGIIAATHPEPSDVPKVLGRLKAIQGTFRGERLANAKEPPDLKTVISDLKNWTDGVVCFNHLYRVITADINKEIKKGGFFHSDNFLTRFDVIFADRYLDAIRRYADPAEFGPAPECWRILFKYREDQKIHPMQFAICGVACHVWMDLPIAVVRVCKEMGKSLDDHTRSDYQKVNVIFDEKIPKLRKHYEDHFERKFDRSIFKRLANRICDCIVVQSRNLAWQHAKELWEVWDPPDNDELTKKENDLDNQASAIVRVILWIPLTGPGRRDIPAVVFVLLRTGLTMLIRKLTDGCAPSVSPTGGAPKTSALADRALFYLTQRNAELDECYGACGGRPSRGSRPQWAAKLAGQASLVRVVTHSTVRHYLLRPRRGHLSTRRLVVVAQRRLLISGQRHAADATSRPLCQVHHCDRLARG
jgi:Family of unknown function (DUF5995)